jgi:hypothetical protein
MHRPIIANQRRKITIVARQNKSAEPDLTVADVVKKKHWTQNTNALWPAVQITQAATISPCPLHMPPDLPEPGDCPPL